mgnify:CR=1 FL=1
MLFELDNVELYFKNKPVLNGIYLKAETGKVTGILGRNGCGKSCLLDIAFGNLKAKYQLIRINNRPVLKPLYATGLVKYLPQYHFIPNGFKVKKAFQLFKVSWTSFTALFAGFEMFENHKFGKLSGGERRLIEAYIILKGKSNIVLLDEPFSHLAPLYINSITSLIKEEKRHKTIIITDHHYKEVIAVSDDIYLLKNGTTKHVDNLKELEDYQYVSQGSLG